MTDHMSLRRRRLLELAGSTAAAGLLAGCGGPGAGEQTAAGTQAGPEGGAGGGAQGGGSREGEEGSQRVEEWLSETDNYEGVIDRTDTNRAAVTVGAEGNGGNRAFDPAAVRISPGMTVRWTWSGEGQHNVVAKEEEFESGPPENRNEPFDFTFENQGTYLYYCERHEGVGMKGAIVVGEGGGGGNESGGGSGTDSGGNESGDDSASGVDTDGEGTTEDEGTSYDDGNGSVTS